LGGFLEGIGKSLLEGETQMIKRITSMSALAASLLLGLAVAGFQGTALAQPNVPIQISGTNVCTGELIFSEPNNQIHISKDKTQLTPMDPLTLTWDGALLKWPDNQALSGFQATMFVESQGPPEDRKCKTTVTNTAFLNGNSVELLPATALQQVGSANYKLTTQTLSNTFSVPLGTPPSYYVYFASGEVETTGINQTAPAGDYTSVVTFSVSAVAP
jgi:hypothetical protein